MPETTEPLTEVQVDEIEARANAATEGPWTLYTGGGITAGQERHCVAKVEFARLPQSMVDGRFIAHARTDIPRLIRDWRAMKAQNEWQKSTIENLTTGVSGCAERLAQATQENAALREKLAQAETGRDTLLSAMNVALPEKL